MAFTRPGIWTSAEENLEGSFANPTFMPDSLDKVGGYESPSEHHIYSTIPETLHDTIRSINHFPSGRYVSENNNTRPDIPVPVPSSANKPKSYTKNGRPVRPPSSSNSVRTSVASTASTVRSTAPLASSPRNSITFGKNIGKWRKVTFFAVFIFLVLSLATSLLIYFTIFYQHYTPTSSPLTDNDKLTMSIVGSVRIIGGDYSIFTQDLRDPLSARYQNMTKEFMSQMNEIMSNGAKDVYNYTEILNFSQGSVIVTYQVNFKAPVLIFGGDVAADTSATTSTFKVQSIIKNEVKTVGRRSTWGRYIVDPNSFLFSVGDNRNFSNGVGGMVSQAQTTINTHSTVHPTTRPTNCHPVVIPQCLNTVTYNQTSTPIASQRTLNLADHMQRLNSCYEHAAFVLCSRAAPKCDAAGDTVLPCRQYCEGLRSVCGGELSSLSNSYLLQCSDYPSDGNCLHPPEGTTISTSTSAVTSPSPETTTPPKCEANTLEFCQMNWNGTIYPNFVDQNSPLEARFAINLINLIDWTNVCSQNLHMYACALLVPKCDVTNRRIPPCRRLCEETNSSCVTQLLANQVSLPFLCNSFPDSDDPDVCIQPPRIITPPTIPSPTCAPSTFDCGEGECRPMRDRCDGTIDCSNRADEVNCESVTCVSTQFKCGGGECRPLSWRCDGEPDCPDGSDEKNCDGEASCTAGQFKCRNGGESVWQHGNSCIESAWQCDGNRDCTDNSDEDPALCDEANTNSTTPST